MTAALPEPPPLPPADLHSRALATISISERNLLHRFYTASNDPLYFDRSLSGRLNAPDAGYGVLYTAAGIEGAFAETFLRVPGRTLLPLSLVRLKAHVAYAPSRPLVLVLMSGAGLAQMGATAQVTHGGQPYDVPQRWSRALHDHPAGFDGIAYRGRHDESICYAVFDRAASALTEVHRRTDLDRGWFWTLAERYGVGTA